MFCAVDPSILSPVVEATLTSLELKAQVTNACERDCFLHLDEDKAVRNFSIFTKLTLITMPSGTQNSLLYRTRSPLHLAVDA